MTDIESAGAERAPVSEAEPSPQHVVEALARVVRDIGGLTKWTAEQRRAKGLHVESGINYAYRGIDQIAGAAAPLFGKHGVVIVPTETTQEVTKIVKGNATIENTAWTRTTMTITWTIYGPGGLEDCFVAQTIGVGDDSSDKGSLKAGTAAYKLLLLRILCIGDPMDDTDSKDPQPEQTEVVVLFERLKALAGTPEADEIKRSAEGLGKDLKFDTLRDDPTWRTVVTGMVDAAEQQRRGMQHELKPESEEGAPEETPSS